MRQHKTLILDKKDVEKLADMKRVIQAVEDVFREYGRGKVQMPAKIYLHLDKYSGDFRAMPAYVEKLKRCALKWVNVHPKNIKFNLPTVMAVIILSDPKTGLPLSIMEGSLATALRTGAAGAVAAKYLARENSKIVSMVGCGVQAKAQLLAINEIFRIQEVNVWGNEHFGVRRFISEMKRLRLKISEKPNIEECVKAGDIVITTTPSRYPLIRLGWLKKGVHINAIGADAKGKQELDPDILKSAKVVVDSWEQACHSGEINVPFKKGILSRKDIYADIGEIVCGKKRGRKTADELTVFDSTGLAIQDVAIADLIYRTALRKRMGKWTKLI